MLFLLEHLPRTPLRILDFGGGLGENSPLRNLAAIDIFEIDKVAHNTIELKDQVWELISIMNVLEHVMDPISVLRTARDFLADETSHIVVEVPLERFMQVEHIQSEYWLSKRIWTEHINCFSSAGLEKCLDASGLVLVAPIKWIKTQEDGVSSRGISTTMIALAGIKST